MIARAGLAALLGLLLAGCHSTGPIVFNCDGFEGPQGYGQAEVPSAYVRQIRGEPDPAPAPAGQWKAAAPAGLEAAIEKAQAENPLPAALQPPSPPSPERILTLDEALAQVREPAPPAKPDKGGEDDWLDLPGGAAPGPVAADLLLSGGGQWGAFGAGFLSQLNRAGFGQQYKFSIITGVSTGAFQAMFVGAGAPEDYAALERVYQPKAESLLVRRYKPSALAVVTGEMAAIGRLRVALEDQLCAPAALAQAMKAGGTLSRADVLRICPMVARLAEAGLVTTQRPKPDRLVFIGMVRADDGRFIAANATQIALDAYARPTSPARLRNAQQCLAAIGLASAAMPLFYQQVQIRDDAAGVGPRTYYDGGVRQSVFEAALAQDRQDAKVNKPLFVLRNGPTALLTRNGEQDQPGADPKTNGTADALNAALRAEKIVVNQVEVQSIADLRLTNPEGPVYFVTGDKFHQFTDPATGKTCTKQDKDAMFDPAFMACLHKFGMATASVPGGRGHLIEAWRRLKTAKEVGGRR